MCTCNTQGHIYSHLLTCLYHLESYLIFCTTKYHHLKVISIICITRGSFKYLYQPGSYLMWYRAYLTPFVRGAAMDDDLMLSTPRRKLNDVSKQDKMFRQLSDEVCLILASYGPPWHVKKLHWLEKRIALHIRFSTMCGPLLQTHWLPRWTRVHRAIWKQALS